MLIRISDLITLPELSKAEYTGNSDYISNIRQNIPKLFVLLYKTSAVPIRKTDTL